MSLSEPLCGTEKIITALRTIGTCPLKDVTEWARLAADELARLDEIRKLYATQIHYWMALAATEATE